VGFVPFPAPLIDSSALLPTSISLVFSVGGVSWWEGGTFFSFLFSFCCMLGIIVLFMKIFQCACDCLLVIIGWDGLDECFFCRMKC